MYYKIRHSIPGRIRLEYNSIAVTPRQAALAENLIVAQDGINYVSFNPVVGTFLVMYSTDRISEKEVLAFFQALDGRYLDDEAMLASVPVPEKTVSLGSTLAAMTISYLMRRLLPTSIRTIFRIRNLSPRILSGAKCLLSGKISDTHLLDAAAITVALASGNRKTAENISFLLSVGETIEEFTKRKSLDDLALTMFSGKENVHVYVDEEREEVRPLSAIHAGDTIIVRTGDAIHADGEVSRGEALVNQATITGEPLAVEKQAGSTVFAGTFVEEGEIYVLVRHVGSQTKVSRILSEIDTSSELKVSSQKRTELLADKLVKYNFILTALTMLFTRNTAKILSTLMVDYSCAMKLTAPIAVLSAMKEAAEHGLLVKGGKFLEEIAKADTVIFDKTGTLTNASPVLSRVICFSDESENDLLRLAACLEEHYVHPVAKAIVKAADERNLDHPERHAQVEYIVAHGIASYIGKRRVLIGSRHFIFFDEHTEIPEGLDRIQNEAIRKGESLLYMAEEGRLLAVFALSDPIRMDAASVVSKLRESGIRECVMITGDDEGAARAVAESAGLNHYISRALPEDKSRYVREYREAGHKVVMLGDGINDAPALASADTGIAMGESAAIAGETADVVLSGENGLEGVVTLRALGNGLLERIKEGNRNIVLVNTSLIILGLLGFVSPAMSALLHNASTVAFAFRASRPILKEAR